MNCMGNHMNIFPPKYQSRSVDADMGPGSLSSLISRLPFLFQDPVLNHSHPETAMTVLEMNIAHQIPMASRPAVKASR